MDQSFCWRRRFYGRLGWVYGGNLLDLLLVDQYGGKISEFAIGRPTFAVILDRLAAIFLDLLLVDRLLMAASLWRSAWSSFLDLLLVDRLLMAASLWRSAWSSWIGWRQLSGSAIG